MFLQAIGQECWQSSSLMTAIGEDFPSAVVESHPALTTYALLFCLLYFLIFAENSLIAILISCRSLLNSLVLEDTLSNKNLTYAIGNTALLCLPTLALTLYFLDLSSLNFIFILAALSAFTLVHLGLRLLSGWLKHAREMFRAIGVCDRICLIIYTGLLLLLLPFYRYFHLLDRGGAAAAAAISGAFLLIMLAQKSFKIFKGNNFSILFWFLYLCALEVLPLGLLIRVLIRL